MKSTRRLAELMLQALRNVRAEKAEVRAAAAGDLLRAADRYRPRAQAITKRAFGKAKASLPRPSLELALNAGDTERVIQLVDAAMEQFGKAFRRPFSGVLSQVQGAAGVATAKKLDKQLRAAKIGFGFGFGFENPQKNTEELRANRIGFGFQGFGFKPVKKTEAELRAAAFNPDQPRDADGKFAPAGGGEPGSTSGSTRESLSRRFPVAGKTVDGRTVRSKIPNESSIDSSLDSYEVLPGVREISMSDMDPNYNPTSYSAAENERIDRLAEQITESGEINPLIIVIDKEKHPYVLEGGHRYDALKRLQAKSFPAKVVIDTSEVELKDNSFRSAAPEVSGFAFDRTNPRAKEWVNEHVGELIDDMSKSTRERVKDLVERTVDGEFDTHDLADRITELIGDESRAETIARTETMAASNGGQREAWAQAVDDGLLNGDEKEEWITTPDGDTCDICQPMDGVTKPLGGKFNVDGELIDGPPAHPRCRCTTALNLES